MKARVPWSVPADQPAADPARAARETGVSVGEWLNSAIFGGSAARSAQNQDQDQDAAAPPREDTALADIHRRLDVISRQLAQLARAMPAPPPAPLAPEAPAGIDHAVAEIAARQSQLERRAAAQPAGPDFSGLERQIRNLTGEIASLRQPGSAEQAIAGFRGELAEIRRSLTDALPRRAIEQLDGDIQALGRRIDDTRHDGADAAALAGIERTLGDIREALRALTPAEQLAGIEDTVRALAGRVDLIVRASTDPMAVQQLEAAITALRGLVAHVASDETLARIADDVRTLGARVDELARERGESSGLLAALEQRITQLTTALENRERPDSPELRALETAVQSLSERLERLQIDREGPAAFADLETRIGTLLERFDASDARLNYLAKIEDSLSESMQRLEQRRTDFGAGPAPASALDTAAVDAIRGELADIRLSQSDSERRTQDSLDVVHSTLGQLVDRLGAIEDDLREARQPAAAPAAAPAGDAAPAPAWHEAAAIEPESEPELEPKSEPEPAVAASRPAFLDVPLSDMPLSAPHPVATLSAPELPNPVLTAPPIPTAADMLAVLNGMPLPLREAAASPEPVAEPEPAPLAAAAPEAPAPVAFAAEPATPEPAAEPDPTPAAVRPAMMARPPIDPSLPPDHPLEPGTRIESREGRSATDRIAASQAVLADLPPPREAPSKTNFIAAARRAAKAATATAGEKPAARAVFLKDKPITAAAPEQTTFSAKLRSLLVGVSVVVIVLGTLRVAINLFDGPGAPPAPVESSAVMAPSVMAPSVMKPSALAPAREPATAPSEAPARSEPPPLPERQTLQAPITPAPPPAVEPEATGSIEAPRLAVAPPPEARAPQPPAASAYSDKLPEAIGSATLRAAAQKGDAGAAYEVASRYAEGKRVALNYEEALKWYGRAAERGLVPALFRLGGLYEKGLGVKKDVETARRYYTEAAERGNAKAMHNLAVLHADGGMKSPDYRTAAQWFRKAAERGIADSQYNLGVLYARGIGIEQNLAEAFKWFSLAAAQGDADAGRKRDDIAKRLDVATLNAAQLAVQTFTAERQPDVAVSVAAPAGGWDQTAKPAAAKGPAKSPDARAPGARPVSAAPATTTVR